MLTIIIVVATLIITALFLAAVIELGRHVANKRRKINPLLTWFERTLAVQGLEANATTVHWRD